MAMTFGQLLVQLEELKKSDPDLLKSDCPYDLAVTLPGRKLFFVDWNEEDEDAA